MKIYLMTDMEAAAGIIDFENWCTPESRYYELGKEFVTLEANAAADGFFAGGASEILVADGHGHGALNPKQLDSRVELLRGWPEKYPFLLDGSYDAIAWIGQHAMSRTEFAHLAHTGSFSVFEQTINGLAIGEPGQFAVCAAELGVPAIFAAGDLAFTKEAQTMFPGIETVSVKRGTTPGRGDECTAEEYARRNTAAIHLHPAAARKRIFEGAKRAVERARKESFSVMQIKAPFERVTRFRPQAGQPARIDRQTHATSVIAAMNMPYNPVLLGG